MGFLDEKKSYWTGLTGVQGRCSGTEIAEKLR
jgi:hypothetical protein